METQTQKIIFLGLDCERTGAMSGGTRAVDSTGVELPCAEYKYSIIGLGAVVIDNNFNKLDEYSCNCYFPSDTVFEPRCMEQFWSKNLEALEKLEYKGPLTKSEREKEMIETFQAFRSKWEKYAEETGCKFYIVSDNNVYDGGFINELIFKYMPDTLPLPYYATKKEVVNNGVKKTVQEYESFFETHSMAKGFLLSEGIDADWGLFDKIKQLYDIPRPNVPHDHDPVHDAYTIAFDAGVLFGLCEKKYKKL